MPQYQGVWTLQNQAQAQSQQQWVTDPNFKNTTLLLQADGTGSGSQNQTFLDSSTNNFFITRNGNTTQGSFTPFSAGAGYWGNYFNGTSDYLTIGTGVTFGAGAFTIECWFNANAFGTWYTIIGNGGTNSLTLSVDSATSVKIDQVNVGSDTYTVSSISLNAWHHLVAVRDSSNNMTVFVDGVRASTGTTTVTKNYSVSTKAVGYVAGGDYWHGYISNLRCVVGTAVYSPTSSTLTVPTAPLTAITNTQLLTCQSNRFIDNSTNAYSLTPSGSPSVQAFSPFAPQYQWTSDVIGGSGYFDGSGDYLQAPNNAAFQFSGAFTIEMWVYPTQVTSRADLVTTPTSPSSASGIYFFINSSAAPFFGSGAASFITSSKTVSPNTWTHLALTRDGSNVATIWVNGVSGGTATVTQNFSDGNLYVGTENALANYFQGYMSSIRVVKGTAIYTTTFTPPTAPLTAITNTSLLLNCTNAGIYDGKMNTSWETVNSAQVSTSTVKYGSGSIYFNGVSSQRLLPSQLYPQLTPGTGDFTIECWLYIVAKGATSVGGIIDYRPGVNGTYVNWVVDFGGYSSGTATAPILVLYADSAVFITSSVISMGQWNHVALCRANGYTRMFINGTLASAVTADTKNYASGGSAANYRPTIGCTDGGDSLYGYIDDFRISRFARYIANFTPPQVALPRQ